MMIVNQVQLCMQCICQCAHLHAGVCAGVPADVCVGMHVGIDTGVHADV